MANNLKLIYLITTGLLVGLIGRFYNNSFNQWIQIDNGFHILRFFLYLVVPILLNLFILKFKWSDLGIRWPQLNRRSWALILGFTFVTPLLVYTIKFNSHFINTYSFFADATIAWQDRALRFTYFTISNLIGWEFLHRSLLLFGLLHIFRKQIREKEGPAEPVAILWVMTFEVFYHLIKPDLEAFAMLAASPLLSWLALRTKSLWPALFVHTYIEVIFILVLINL